MTRGRQCSDKGSKKNDVAEGMGEFMQIMLQVARTFSKIRSPLPSRRWSSQGIQTLVNSLPIPSFFPPPQRITLPGGRQIPRPPNRVSHITPQNITEWGEETLDIFLPETTQRNREINR